MAALPPLRRQSDSTTHLAHPLQHHTQPQLPLKPATHQPRSEATEAQHLDAWERDLDPGIAPFVKVLRNSGIETFESCEGGPGHAMPEPTIRFHGQRSEGFRALAVALQLDLPIGELRRSWPVLNGEPTGPYWEMTLYLPSESRRAQ